MILKIQCRKIFHSLILLLLLVSVSNTNAQWIKKMSDVSGNLKGVVMLDSSTAIVIGEYGSILKTTDAGESWEHKEPDISIATGWNTIYFYNKNEGVIAGKYNVIMTTENGGEDWILRSAGEGENEYTAAAYPISGRIYVGDISGRIWESSDSGKTWSSEQLSELPIRSVFPWTGAHITGLPIYALTSYSLYSKVDFPSGEWSETPLESFRGLGSEAISGEFSRGGGPGFIAGVWGDFVYSPAIVRKKLTDTTWEPLVLNEGIGALYDISAPSEKYIYVSGSDGIIFKSVDGGDSWYDLGTPTTAFLNSIYFYNERIGFAVGDSGTILYTANGGEEVTSVKELPEVLKDELELRQNYPNPFNPETNIFFSLPKGGDVTLKIYNVNGEEVSVLVNKFMQAGSYSVNWNAADYSSGIYFYRISAGGENRIRKMVLVK